MHAKCEVDIDIRHVNFLVSILTKKICILASFGNTAEFDAVWNSELGLSFETVLSANILIFDSKFQIELKNFV
jgi:hypothetical protein